jgi:presenilin-like A22 family membrane protease
LAAYDVISVFGTSLLSIQAAGAFDVGIASSSVIDSATSTTGFAPDNLGIETSSLITAAGDTSVMETVARAKLEGPWRPGLLEMVLVGRVSDVIGLGDIVFPACLVSWGFALNMSYASATIGGYVLGSLLTEIASTLGPNQGLPALIFIAPAMLTTVSLVAIQRGEMTEI